MTEAMTECCNNSGGYNKFFQSSTVQPVLCYNCQSQQWQTAALVWLWLTSDEFFSVSRHVCWKLEVKDKTLINSLSHTTTCWSLVWQAVRTVYRTYRAQFNLMKDVKVRIYTVLNGPCTNNTTIKSTNYTELIQKPPSTGQCLQSCDGNKIKIKYYLSWCGTWMNICWLVFIRTHLVIEDTAVLDFICMFHNMEYVECKWKRSPKTPANSQQSLYFW